MKKIIAVLTALLILAVLAGCGESAAEGSIPMASKEEQKAFDAACELMEQGKYSEAADAFANVPLYDAIWSKLNEINRLTGSASADALTGTWYNLNGNDDAMYDKHDYYLEFPGNGRVVFGTKSESGGLAFSYSYEGDAVYFYVPSTQATYRLSVSQIDGITHLIGALPGTPDCDFVPAEYYEELKQEEALPDVIEPVSIELTLDTWEEYFEIRPYHTSQTNSWGEVSNERNGFAFYLKDEYLDRYTRNTDEAIFFYLKIPDSDNPSYHFYAVIDDYRDYGIGVFGTIQHEDGDYNMLAELSKEALDALSVVNVTGHLLLSP